MDLARCLEDLLRMLTPLPRLERARSRVGCSLAPQRPSPSGWRVGSCKKLSRPAQSSHDFRPAHLHLGCTEDFPGGFSGRSLASTAPVATGRTDNSPDGTSTRWPSRPRRYLRILKLSSRQTSFRVAQPGTSPGRMTLPRSPAYRAARRSAFLTDQMGRLPKRHRHLFCQHAAVRCH
jgi:hypothetical protein